MRLINIFVFSTRTVTRIYYRSRTESKTRPLYNEHAKELKFPSFQVIFNSFAERLIRLVTNRYRVCKKKKPVLGVPTRNSLGNSGKISLFYGFPVHSFLLRGDNNGAWKTSKKRNRNTGRKEGVAAERLRY